ncbi:glycosyltransferase family 4 protein [Pontibaca salina]|uniref:UDP-N-acetylmuramyl pentapeptide phosphotransferase/UDP-N-acetylglucosamine-1-phosphate transferase n=1 Tax=Pontibaca salina TaxID=2795731 RepID=A0A934HTY1_9RHOB|nr:glycosyltransferase [Pontibaca salina]MBI6630771.1 hypothetical protein [Pontibaca salina]
MEQPNFMWHELVITNASFLVCFAMVIAARHWPRLAGRPADMSAVQSAHTRMTPRTGGVSILAALLAVLYFAPREVKTTYACILFSSCFVFVAGLLEDLGFGVSPRNRLLAAIFSSLAVIGVGKIWLPQLGIPPLDHLASLWLVGVPLTLLVTAGLANGFNLIDGVNGLAGFTAITAVVSMSFIARSAGLGNLADLALMFAAGIFGFWIVNYPSGVIFLGDAGAYILGFLLGWLGIVILVQAPAATPWALLLTVFWPVADTVLAIYRRRSRKQAKMQPDRLHVHQLMMRALELLWLGRERRNISNPLTTLALAPKIVAPAAVGVLLWNQPLYAFIAMVLFSALFVSSYFMAFPALRKLLPRMERRRERRQVIEAGRNV